MLDWVLNTALFLQRQYQSLVLLKYFTSFKVAFKVLNWKKLLYLKNSFRKIERKNGDFALLNKSFEPYKLP